MWNSISSFFDRHFSIDTFMQKHSDGLTAAAGGGTTSFFAYMHFSSIISVIVSAAIGAFISLLIKDLYTYKIRRKIFKESQHDNTYKKVTTILIIIAALLSGSCSSTHKIKKSNKSKEASAIDSVGMSSLSTSKLSINYLDTTFTIPGSTAAVKGQITQTGNEDVDTSWQELNVKSEGMSIKAKHRIKPNSKGKTTEFDIKADKDSTKVKAKVLSVKQDKTDDTKISDVQKKDTKDTEVKDTRVDKSSFHPTWIIAGGVAFVFVCVLFLLARKIPSYV